MRLSLRILPTDRHLPLPESIAHRDRLPDATHHAESSLWDARTLQVAFRVIVSAGRALCPCFARKNENQRQIGGCPPMSIRTVVLRGQDNSRKMTSGVQTVPLMAFLAFQIASGVVVLNAGCPIWAGSQRKTTTIP